MDQIIVMGADVNEYFFIIILILFINPACGKERTNQKIIQNDTNTPLIQFVYYVCSMFTISGDRYSLDSLCPIDSSTNFPFALRQLKARMKSHNLIDLSVKLSKILSNLMSKWAIFLRVHEC